MENTKQNSHFTHGLIKMISLARISLETAIWEIFTLSIIYLGFPHGLAVKNLPV